MQTLDELAGLARATFGLWRRHLPALLTWLALGWAVRELSFHLGVLFGANRVAALACFAFGMVFWVVSIIGMLFTVTRAPKAFSARRRADAPPIPQRQWRDVMVEAVVPFLALYAVWGLTEDQVQRAFTANLTWWGIDAANFSISFADWRLYLVVTIVAWALQAALGWVFRNRPKGILVSVVLTFLRGVAILTAFIGLDTIWVKTLSWLKERQVWGWVSDAWQGFIDTLPRWELPIGLNVPELVAELGRLTWSGLLPGLLTGVLLPLLWLALTALTVGWQDFTSGVTGGRFTRILEGATGRAKKLGARSGRSPLAVAERAVAAQLEPLMPVVESFRLVLRAGLPLLGAYLVLAAVGRGLSGWLDDVIIWLIGPNSIAVTVRYTSLAELVAEAVAWPLLACLYAATFDRVLQISVWDDQPSTENPIPARSLP